MPDPRELQFQLEEQSDTAAAAARLNDLRTAAASGDAGLPRSTALIARLFAGVRDSIEITKAKTTTGVAAKFKQWLRAVDSDVLAVLALRECVKQHHYTNDDGVTIQSLAGAIGRLVELEVRIAEAERVNPVYMQRIHEQVKENGTSSQHHLRRLYNTAYNRVMKGAFDSELTNAESIHVGKFLVQACIDAGVLYLFRGTGSKGTLLQLRLQPEVEEFLTGYNYSDVRSVIDKEATAMFCPPDPWSSINDGGFLTERRKISQPLLNLSRVRKSERQNIRDAFTAENMPMVFQAGNYLQAQAYELNTPVFQQIQALWASGGGVLGVPTRDMPKRPEPPFPSEWVKEDATPEELEHFTLWKAEARRYYTALKTWRGRVREISGFLRVSSKINKPMWFPVYLDKRGRWYYRGVPNPQGSDISKAVLQSHTKKPLGKAGLFWLKVHIANSYGFDKERFVDRARWTEQNWDSIVRALEHPADYPDVWGKDSPWCMYAAALELRNALSSPSPEQYESGLIVHMDATCSGLQHFSAILRDPVGARYVNLIDESKCGQKQDIYARVAELAMQGIALDRESSDPAVKAMADWWMQTGIPRGMAKKPVMTYVYGATLRGTVEFIEDYISAEMPEVKYPEDIRQYDLVQYCAKKLFQGIAGTVPAADAAMQWLRNVAREYPRGKRMQWRTVTGFPVQHDYQDYTEKRVELKSCGINMIRVREWNDDTRPIQMQNAISPNFVHALDASHLTLTALRAESEGLFITGIHDSFGTHAADVDVLHRCIREAFVELYEHRNPLAEFLWDIKMVQETPTRGSLDIRKVLESEFFFC